MNLNKKNIFVMAILAMFILSPVSVFAAGNQESITIIIDS